MKNSCKDCPCAVPCEKKLLNSINNNIPLSFPKWEATGEYIESNTSTKNNNNKSFVLLKDSKFILKTKNDVETYTNTLYEDIPLNINGKIRTKFGSTFAIIGNNSDESLDKSITIIEPIIYYNGTGIKSVGKYNIQLITDDSKIRVAKGQTIEFDGNVKVILVDDLVLDFVSVLPQEIEKIQENVVVPENNIERIVISPPTHQKIILTRELLAKLS
jgi:hypothetical protein